MNIYVNFIYMLDMMFYSNAALLSLLLKKVTFDLPEMLRRDYNDFCCIVYILKLLLA